MSNTSEKNRLGFAKARISVYLRRIKCEHRMWLPIEKSFNNRFRIHEAEEALMEKWVTLPCKEFVCDSCRYLFESNVGTGNWSEENIIKMVQALYAAKIAANPRAEPDLYPRGPFIMLRRQNIYPFISG